MAIDFSKYHDNELQKIISGESSSSEKAFLELYHRYHIKIYTYCCRMLDDPEQAKDVFQDTFIKFHNRVKEGINLDNVPAYLFMIARNQCLNVIRNKKNTVEIREDFLKTNHVINYESDELFELIRTALDLLDDIHKEAFIMRKFQNMSFKEMSDICGISIEGVKKRVKTASKRIIKILEPYIRDLSK